MLASELLLDPPDLEDLAEKSSRFFLATDSEFPEAAEAWPPAPVPCPPSVEDELWREGDRWIVGGEDLEAVKIPGERSSSTELPRSEKSIQLRVLDLRPISHRLELRQSKSSSLQPRKHVRYQGDVPFRPWPWAKDQRLKIHNTHTGC